MLKDQFGRTHDYLRISITDKCNLKCFYCRPEHDSVTAKKNCFQYNATRLRSNEILEIAGVFVHHFGVKKIRLTGGEPLIRRNVGHLIEELSHLPVELGITTNAVLLDQYFSLFKKIGLKSINISLDSLSIEKFESFVRRKVFDKVKSNIYLAIDKGFFVKVNVVTMQNINDDEINDFIDWTKDLAVHVRFIEFMPFAGNNWKSEKVLSYKEILQRIKSVYPLEKLKDGRNSTSKSYRVKGHKGTFAVISSITEPFCDSCNRIRITADGKLKNCLFSNEEVDLAGALRNGQDIVPVIQSCFDSKCLERGGLEEFSTEKVNKKYENGRSMTAIGG